MVERPPPRLGGVRGRTLSLSTDEAVNKISGTRRCCGALVKQFRSTGLNMTVTSTSSSTSNRREQLDLRRAKFEDEISLWTRNRMILPPASREVLSRLAGFDRIAALRHATLDAMFAHYRLNRKCDVAPGIIALVGALSDNEYGVCYLAVPRMANLFSRSDRRIRSAIRRLERSLVLMIEPQPGRPSHLSLRLAPSIAADPTASIMWSINVHAPRNRASTSALTLSSGVTVESSASDTSGSEPLTVESPNFTVDSTKETSPAGAPKLARPHRPAITLNRSDISFERWVAHLYATGHSAAADMAKQTGSLVVDRRWP